MKGKRVATAKDAAAEGRKKRTEELDRKRQEDVFFFLSNLDGPTLIARYAYMWGRETKDGHGAPEVYPEGTKIPSNS